jgi:SNF2 family DNA or RNA helicase
LRRDASKLSRLEFDYVVLDEAHGIKNAATESYRAASALGSRRRLALTGTPVENHLGELWSLLRYLNPSVMRNMAHLQKIFSGRRLDSSSLEAGVLKSIQPFILRRTKLEVARDLPERIEKTIDIELSRRERELYDDLASYYRRRLLEARAIDKHLKQRNNGGAGREMAEVLEGLLRLRQAACHPGLLDDSLNEHSSAKFEVLIARLLALRAEGHKALVFSQFVKLLALLEPHLRRAGLGYSYLDGKTRDREGAVDRFSRDPNVSVFLISLKAGGVGLNLVAADYVFLLDPWWNPAAEAQAIDRTHRIGQKRTVVAYRLLSRDTVEGKVAALQDEKRELSLALFGDTSNFSAKFSREDLEHMLS